MISGEFVSFRLGRMLRISKLQTIIKKRLEGMSKLLNNPHPGEILQEEFLRPLGLSQNDLSKAIGVPANRVSEIVRGRRGITADTDLRLARFFDLSQGYWLRLQNSYDLMEVQRDHLAEINKISPFNFHATFNSSSMDKRHLCQ